MILKKIYVVIFINIIFNIVLIKKIGVNGRTIKKVSDLSKIVNVISFIPSDVNLLKDTPKKRNCPCRDTE